MKLNEIQDMIEKDSVITVPTLTENMISIPIQHAKYQRIFVDETKVLKSIMLTVEKDYKHLYDYYLGYANDDVYKERPLNRKVLKTEVETYINSDPIMLEHKRLLEIQKVKVDLVESYLKSLSQRTYLCKSIIDWEKFKNGER